MLFGLRMILFEADHAILVLRIMHLFAWRMILPENRFPSPINVGDMLFGSMLKDFVFAGHRTRLAIRHMTL